eukprot:369015_1
MGYVSYNIDKSLHNNNKNVNKKDKLIITFDVLNKWCNVDIDTKNNYINVRGIYSEMILNTLSFQHRGDVMCKMNKVQKLVTVRYFKSFPLCVCGIPMCAPLPPKFCINSERLKGIKCSKCNKSGKYINNHSVSNLDDKYFQCLRYNNQIHPNGYYLCEECGDRPHKFIDTRLCKCGAEIIEQTQKSECCKKSILKCTNKECKQFYDVCSNCFRTITLGFDIIGMTPNKNNQYQWIKIVIRNKTDNNILNIALSQLDASLSLHNKASRVASRKTPDPDAFRSPSHFELGAGNNLELYINRNQNQTTFTYNSECEFYSQKQNKWLSGIIKGIFMEGENIKWLMIQHKNEKPIQCDIKNVKPKLESYYGAFGCVVIETGQGTILNNSVWWLSFKVNNENQCKGFCEWTENTDNQCQFLSPHKYNAIFPEHENTPFMRLKQFTKDTKHEIDTTKLDNGKVKKLCQNIMAKNYAQKSMQNEMFCCKIEEGAPVIIYEWNGIESKAKPLINSHIKNKNNKKSKPRPLFYCKEIQSCRILNS